MKYSIPGHERQKNILEKYLENNSKNLPNGILFSGEEGIGKFETGKDFAKKILENCHCEEGNDVAIQSNDTKKEKNNNLGKNNLSLDKNGNISLDCHAALAMTNKNFISIGEIFYEGQKDEEIAKTTNFPQEHRKKAKVKSNTISIDDIHKIIEISEKTSEGGKKVFLIKNIERMNNSAANAFLKTLEESKNSIFICTTENKNLLLPTIISRFQEIEFFKLSDGEIKKFLEEKNLKLEEKLSEKILEEFTKFSFGKISLAKKFLESEENFFEIKKIFEDGKNFLDSRLRGNDKNSENEKVRYSEIYKKSDFLFKNKEKIKDEIFFLENFLNREGKNFFGEEKFLEVYENFLELKKGLKSNQNIKLIFDNFYHSVI